MRQRYVEGLGSLLEHDFAVFALNIRHTSSFATLLSIPTAKTPDSADQVFTRALAIMAGDAVFSAHYRLGVGINSVSTQVMNLHILLSSLRAAGGRSLITASQPQQPVSSGVGTEAPLSADQHARTAWTQVIDAVSVFARASDEFLTELIELQLSTMMLESECGFVVFFDGSKPSVTLSQVRLETFHCCILFDPHGVALT